MKTTGYWGAGFLVLISLATGEASGANWNPLPDTGQTICYDVAGNVIGCPQPGQPLHGQDANYQGVQPSYTNNGNGTVTDNNTGLIWQQNTADTNGSGTISSADRRTWPQAIDYCAGLSHAGASDWRLPSRFELLSILDYGRFSPAINPAFIAVSWGHWSATSYAAFPDNALIVSFEYGGSYSSYKFSGDTFYVRCVRGGL